MQGLFPCCKALHGKRGLDDPHCPLFPGLGVAIPLWDFPPAGIQLIAHKLLLKPLQWAALLLGCLGGQLYLQRHALVSNSYLCVPVHREDASFEEDDDLSEEEEEEELAPIMPAKK